jgi:hypothetical protein
MSDNILISRLEETRSFLHELIREKKEEHKWNRSMFLSYLELEWRLINQWSKN